MRILKKLENKYKNLDIIVECDSKSHSYLLSRGRVNFGWSRPYVFNHISVLQCFKCLGYKHYAKDCKAKSSVCSKCGENHSYKDCKSQTTRCVNCVNKNTMNKTKNIDTNHTALDRECPCRTIIIKELDQRVDYFIHKD